MRGPKQYRAGKPVIRQSGGTVHIRRKRVDLSEEYIDVDAETKYKKILSRDRVTEIKSIAKNTGFKEDEIDTVYSHIFIQSHWISKQNGKGMQYRRFYADNEMADSWERLRTGKDIQEHDIIMLKHELLEIKYMNEGKTSIEANRLADELYNYTNAVAKWLKNGNS